jgi:hypothetical protein
MGSIPETDLRRINNYCEERSPIEHADKVRIEPAVRGKTVTIVERRPPWNGAGDEWTSHGVARMRYNSDTSKWALYWSDSNCHFHLYDFIDPGPVSSLLEEIERDPTCIFWG